MASKRFTSWSAIRGATTSCCSTATCRASAASNCCSGSRHIPSCARSPVILQTASESRTDVLEAMKGGAFYYLTKPYDVEMLLTVVATAVRNRSSYRQLQTLARRGEMATTLLRAACFRLRSVEEARDVGTLVAGLCPDPSNTVIGLTELIVNAVEHGNLGITYAEKSELSGMERWMAEGVAPRRPAGERGEVRGSVVRARR